MLCMFYGLSITELAKATALMFTVPIFATILAIIFLKECSYVEACVVKVLFVSK